MEISKKREEVHFLSVVKLRLELWYNNAIVQSHKPSRLCDKRVLLILRQFLFANFFVTENFLFAIKSLFLLFSELTRYIGRPIFWYISKQKYCHSNGKIQLLHFSLYRSGTCSTDCCSQFKKKKRFSKLLNIKKWNRSVYSLLFALHVGLFWSEKYLRN